MRLMPGLLDGLAVCCPEIFVSRKPRVIWAYMRNDTPDGDAKSIHVRIRWIANAAGQCLDSWARCGHGGENGIPFDEAVTVPGLRVSYSSPGSATYSNCAAHGIYGRPPQSPVQRSLCTIRAIWSAKRGGTAFPTW